MITKTRREANRLNSKYMLFKTVSKKKFKPSLNVILSLPYFLLSSLSYDKLIESNPSKMVILFFQTLDAISNFKKECNCNDFYIDRDVLSIVGTFTDEQLYLAINKYSAICKTDKV